ncbi:MAG: aspartyl/glutamyl-tRNA amidotransferase subunit C [Candidatus Ancillula trichonymphae]|nr:aspartyl/glutamyl-tRNA amidotransferase subunit C [Candidatus Ancillula trichonymphae]
MGEHFTAESIVQLSKLARINLRDDEVVRLAYDLNIINDSIEKLWELNLEGVEITASLTTLDGALREDIPATVHIPADVERAVDGASNPYEGDLLEVDAALSGAPNEQDNRFVVPQILGEE